MVNEIKTIDTETAEISNDAVETQHIASTEENKEVAHNKVLLEWKTPEFITHPKGKSWFLIAGLLILVLIAYALFTGSATMTIVFIVLTGVYYLTHNQAPDIIDIQITELGIYVDKTFHPFNAISHFWIVYHPPYVQTLNFRIGQNRFSKVTVQLNQQDPAEVRRALAREIPEVEGEGESMMDLLIRMLRL